MHLNWLALAVPFFVALMLAEYYFSTRKNLRVYSFEESIANLNVGIAERLSDLFTTGLFFFVFDWIHRSAAIFKIEPRIWTWILLFLFTDLLWYWYHRFGHRVNIFWAVHVVHHQSEDYNYSVSARITVLQAIARGIFWSFLPLIGFPAFMIATLLLVHGTYPFFTHTQLIGKLGWLEYLFVTPSHHRVHHSSNPQYLDKNYGDVLIIWDKLFGTFAKEVEKPVYGLTKPLKSYSFLWQHFHFLLEIGIALNHAKGFLNKLKVLLGKPDNIDPRIRTWLERKFSKKDDSLAPTRILFNYVKLQTICTLILLFLTILLEHYMNLWQLSLASFFIIISIINTGAMMEQRKWVFYLEFSRIFLIYLFIQSVYSHYWFNLLSLSFLTVLLIYFRPMNQRYYALMYEST